MKPRNKTLKKPQRKKQLPGAARQKHKLTEDALRESEARVQAIVNAAVDGILMICEKGIVELFNPAAEAIFGYKAAEVLGKNVKLLMPEPYHREHDTYLNNYLMTGVKKIIGIGREVTGKRKDGTTFPMEIAVSEVRVGQRRMFAGIVRDISERKRLEDQISHMQKMEAIGQLAGGVAHDFNNFLQGMLGFIGRIRRTIPADDPAMVFVKEAQNAVHRATNLTKQLLAFSRRQPIQPKVLQVNALLQNMENMLHRLIGEHIELIILSGKEAGLVKADPVQVEQVILNLAVNARDAMPKGGKLMIQTANRVLDKAYAEHHLEVSPGNHVMISVSDTGEGIADDIKENIFEPFFTTKEVGRGTGLGLSTVYGIIKQHGGHISVYSEPGKGATFRIYLPRVDEKADRIPVETKAEGMVKGSETVLVVEDDPGVQLFVSEALRELNYTVLTASHPKDALGIVQQNKPAKINLLLTDVVMPGMSGKELAELIRAEYPDIKILFMSGYTDELLGHHGILEEGIHFLEKPFTEKTLAEKIRGVLEAR